MSRSDGWITARLYRSAAVPARPQRLPTIGRLCARVAPASGC